MNKRYKYRLLRLLRHLPGWRGRRYLRKFQALTAPEEFDDALRHSADKLCIDLGANIGEYTQKMAKAVKAVIAFEPDPWAYAQLQLNLADFTNVRTENAAASTEDGSTLLWRHKRFDDHPAEYSISSSLMSSKFDVVDHEQAVEVQSINFVDYLCDLNNDIGIIKMDIEGAEVEILEALLDRPDLLLRIDYIFVETHERHYPEHVVQVEALVDRTSRMTRPHFNLSWH